MTSNRQAHAAAFEKWFKKYELERKKRHITKGKTVPGFPPAPPGPDEIRLLIFDSINPLNERKAADLCGVHRTTVLRWLDGSVQIPPAAFALLRFHAEGVPPGCGSAWRGFSWESEALICPDGKTRLSAQEIAGTGYQLQYIASLEKRVRELSEKIESMTRETVFECANDSFTDPNDPRTLAFTSR